MFSDLWGWQYGGNTGSTTGLGFRAGIGSPRPPPARPSTGSRTKCGRNSFCACRSASARLARICSRGQQTRRDGQRLASEEALRPPVPLPGCAMVLLRLLNAQVTAAPGIRSTGVAEFLSGMHLGAQTQTFSFRSSSAPSFSASCTAGTSEHAFRGLLPPVFRQTDTVVLAQKTGIA